MSDFDPRMVEALVCPQTHAPLAYDADRQELISRAAGLALMIEANAGAFSNVNVTLSLSASVAASARSTV